MADYDEGELAGLTASRVEKDQAHSGTIGKAELPGSTSDDGLDEHTVAEQKLGDQTEPSSAIGRLTSHMAASTIQDNFEKNDAAAEQSTGASWIPSISGDSSIEVI